MLTPSDIRNAKILIVDDQAANLELLERMLRDAGQTSIASTRDARAVYALHREHRYDLILLDLSMPGLDELEVIESLKELEEDSFLPVVVITAQPERKLGALRAGAKDFVNTPFDPAEVLTRVTNILEARLLRLQAKRLADQLAAEKRTSEQLLLNVVPPAIAERLKAADGSIIVEAFPEATVLCADLGGFNELGESLSAKRMVATLNEVFGLFDGIAAYRGLERIKTVGPAYIAVSGLPISMADHAQRAAHMALDMITALERFNDDRGFALEMRIGLDSGEVLAGVIGTHRFSYDLLGNTVNTASWMESNGMAGRVQVTEATRQRLPESFEVEGRGPIELARHGQVNAWWLVGRKKASGPRPD